MENVSRAVRKAVSALWELVAPLREAVDLLCDMKLVDASHIAASGQKVPGLMFELQSHWHSIAAWACAVQRDFLGLKLKLSVLRCNRNY